MAERFFSPLLQPGKLTLAGDEAHHLIHVMRARAGDQVTLFDGQGQEATGVIIAIGKREVTVCVQDIREVDRELPVPLCLAAPLPKGDRQRFLIEKLTELGVTQFIPLVTERTVVRPDESAVNRLGRTVIEACKQCGRTRLMALGKPVFWPDFLQSAPATHTRLLAQLRYYAQSLGEAVTGSIPEGQSSVKPMAELLASVVPAGRPILAAVGPEGGFTPQEVDQAVAQGWRCVDLGPRVLRVETAAVALATLCGLAQQMTTWWRPIPPAP